MDDVELGRRCELDDRLLPLLLPGLLRRIDAGRVDKS